MAHDREPPPDADVPLAEGYAGFLSLMAEAAPEASVDRAPPLAEVRARAGEVRVPLNRGGAVMAEVADLALATPLGTVPARLYRPHAQGGGGTLVYFHGGGWVLLGLDSHDRLMRAYAAESGLSVVAIDYPRAPECRFPATVHLCAAAVESVVSLDPGAGAPVLGGDSAGANLALAAALVLRAGRGVVPAGLLLNYGVFDCRLDRPSHALFDAPPYQLTREKMAWFWSLYCPDEDMRRGPLASPLGADLSGLPPVRALIAGLDILRDENLALVRALEAAGTPVIADIVAGAPHGFLEALPLAPESRRAVARSAAWLREVARQ